MMRYEATITSKGQLTLPSRLRQLLSVKPGDKVVFVEDPDGRISLEARRHTFADLRGILRLPASADIEGWVAEARAARGEAALLGDEAPAESEAEE